MGTPSSRYQVLKEPEVKRSLLVGTVVLLFVSVGSALGSASADTRGTNTCSCPLWSC
jgi:hypothetical protein